MSGKSSYGPPFLQGLVIVALPTTPTAIALVPYAFAAVVPFTNCHRSALS